MNLLVPANDKCPVPYVIEQFSFGNLSDQAINQIGCHIEHCNKCMDFLDALNVSRANSLPIGIAPSILFEPELAELKRHAIELLEHCDHTKRKLLTDSANDPQLPFDFRSAADAVREASEAAITLPTRMGAYELLQKIGSGGFADVFLACEKDTGKAVAVKVLRARSIGRPLEAETLMSLNHPLIVSVLNCGEFEPSRWFVAMELVEGESLRNALATSVSPLGVALIIAKVARALHSAHIQGFVHRDIKPENILLDQHNEPHLTDFGLAVHDDQQWEHRGESAGTCQYMSPEQIRRESHRLDGRTDIWSLGVILYEWLTGQRPFRGKTTVQLRDEILNRLPKPLRQIRDSVSLELEQICLRCLAKSMSDRYSTALDLATELESCAFDSPQAALATCGSNAIVPKGLCSFDHRDSDFFLSLLPGPRDRYGIPESIRSWKSRLEANGQNASFGIWLIYGPSGCGKSSFVKAGLLPRIDGSICSIYLEATRDHTPERLVAELARVYSCVSGQESLRDALHKIRHQSIDTVGLLIVLDQFEQAVQNWDQHSITPLIEGLRQCDGNSIQCLLIVRDDFWINVTNFMRQLELTQIEGVNSSAISLFSQSHAEAVLDKFGRAYDRITSINPTEEQRAFITESVDLLSNCGQVVCLQLALFAQMMKDREWCPATLRNVGGLEGLGIQFLEESIVSGSAPKSIRMHETAIRSVLETLLPIENSCIKGESKSRHELLLASGYAERPDSFDSLMHILETKLRLVSLVVATTDSTAARTYGYQLTHDYIVPAIRKWLRLRDETTHRGRANVRLHNRHYNWNLSQENRQLPSFWETIYIWVFSKSASWTRGEAKTMLRATKYHAIRLLAIMLPTLLVLFVASLWLSLSSKLSRLQMASSMGIVEAVESLRPYRRLAIPLLRLRVNDELLDTRSRLRSGLALSCFGAGVPDQILRYADQAKGAELPLVISALKQSNPTSTVFSQNITAIMENEERPNTKVFMALLGLNLGYHDTARVVTHVKFDASLRCQFIDRFSDIVIQSPELIKVLREPSLNHELQSAICLGISNMNAPMHDALADVFAELLTSEPSPCVRSAIEYTLRHNATSNVNGNWIHANDTDRDASNYFHMIPISQGPLMRESDRESGSVDEPIEIGPFWLADREVSMELFNIFVLSRPGISSPDGTIPTQENEVSPGGAYPVNFVNVEDSILFANWLSKREGIPEYYSELASGWSIPDPDGVGYRLPSLDEWEYACRAGTNTIYATGNTAELLSSYASYGDLRSTLPCGSKMPNQWGIFDMSGNVWEWCVNPSRSSNNLPGAGIDNENSESLRFVICGGAYDSSTQDLQPRIHYEINPQVRFNGIGMRLARNAVP